MTIKLFSGTTKLFFRDETNLGHNETYTASFLDKEKERKLQYRWYHSFRSYVCGGGEGNRLHFRRWRKLRFQLVKPSWATLVRVAFRSFDSPSLPNKKSALWRTFFIWWR